MKMILLLTAAVLLDLLIGDPTFIPHPIRGIGWLISSMEKLLRRLFTDDQHRRALLAGGVLAAVVPVSVFLLTFGLIWLAAAIHPLLGFCVEVLLGSLTLAARSLKTESMKVYHQLAKGDLPAARYAVSMIVGRDTQSLDESGVTTAAVETVAENTSDGVIAPLLYLAIGGVPLAMCYKAINTLDSMVGYKNDRYLYFGRASAKLDDIVNWIPARLAGLLTVLCAFLVGLDGKNAWKIYRRDCHNHASPNSAQTESACAGALQVQLAGDAYYFGKLCHKPTIGDPIRPVKPQDIVLANRLMVASDLVFAALCCAAWAMVYWLI